MSTTDKAYFEQPDLTRRRLLKNLIWVPPVVVATATVRARAAAATCTPGNGVPCGGRGEPPC